MKVSSKEKLLQMFVDVVGKYKCAELNMIWDRAPNVDRSAGKLSKECNDMIREFKALLRGTDESKGEDDERQAI